MKQIILTDADGLAENTDPAFLILSISRNEIEAGDIASALERLHVITDTEKNVRMYRESLVFQVGGYDHDKRELPEIPEVRLYFKKLVQEWPHWLWFMPRGFGAIGLLFALLCDVKMQRNPDGSFGTEIVSRAQMASVMGDMMRRGNALFMAYGIDDAEAQASAESVVEDLFGG